MTREEGGRATFGTDQESLRTQSNGGGNLQRFAKIDRVAEIRHFLGARTAESVTPATRTVDAVRQFCRHRDVHTLAVVDGDNKLVGILEIGRLIDDILANVLPEGYPRGILDIDRMLEASFLFTVHDTVEEMMMEPVAVTYEDTAEEAFLRLHSNGLRGYPLWTTPATCGATSGCWSS